MLSPSDGNSPLKTLGLTKTSCFSSTYDPDQCQSGRAILRPPPRESTFLGLVDQEFSPTADTETALSIPWFAAIQGIKRKQNVAGLAPKGCFISAEAIDRVVSQIGETQKATRELSGGIDGRFDRFRRGAGGGFCSVRDVRRSGVAVETDRLGPAEQRIDNLARCRVNLAGLPEPTQMT